MLPGAEQPAEAGRGGRPRHRGGDGHGGVIDGEVARGDEDRLSVARRHQGRRGRPGVARREPAEEVGGGGGRRRVGGGRSRRWRGRRGYLLEDAHDVPETSINTQ